MSTAAEYLSRYNAFPQFIRESPPQNLGIVVVIPAYDEPDILTTLNSLDRCFSPRCSVEVVIVINSADNSPQEVISQNKKTIIQIGNFRFEQNNLALHVIEQLHLPCKHAGVGWARKIGMDEAIRRFQLVAREGIIVCLDADSICSSNYLVEIENHFNTHPLSPGCSINFEHPLIGENFTDEIYEGIVNYELHLRYYRQCMKYCGTPYAYHTIGSAMAVRTEVYRKQGGMNRRKAGEDFYFLHKIISLGNFSELTSATIYPSPRRSHRVPFGTGRAIAEWLDSNKMEYLSYAFDSFNVIRNFIGDLEKIYSGKTYIAANDSLGDFLDTNNFTEIVLEIKTNTMDFASFRKRFFTWFNAFLFLKLTHHLRDQQFQMRPVNDEARKLLMNITEFREMDNSLDLLLLFRKIDQRFK